MTIFPSQEILNVEELFEEGKFEEALKKLNKMETNKYLTLEDKLEIKSLKGFILSGLEQTEKAYNIAIELYNESQKLKKPLYSCFALSIKGSILNRLGRFEGLFKTVAEHERIFKNIPREDSLVYHQCEVQFFIAKGHRNFLAGRLDYALEEITRARALWEEYNLSPNYFLGSLVIMGYIYHAKGELDLALEWDRKALSLIKGEREIMRGTIFRNMGSIYYEKGDLDSALKHHKLGLEAYGKKEKGWWISWSYFHIITILRAKKDFQQAQNYLEQFKQFDEIYESRLSHSLFQLSYASILKSSGRMRERVEAENLYKKIVERDYSIFTTNIALVNLCEWYFKEFQLSNQMDILDDIDTLINHLQRNAKRQSSYSLLANVKLLQAKLAILQISMVEARKFLTEAQSIADEHGLQLLAQVISKEHDKLLEELKLWESIKKSKTSVSDRLKLVSIDEVLERMDGRRAIQPPESTDEDPVLLLIIAEGGTLLFSYPFTEKWQEDDDMLSSFLSAFTSFSDEYFSQGLDRVKFDEDTLLMRSVNSFSVCYLFKGQTYLAKQKLDKFSETIQSISSIWETLEKFNKSSQVIELVDIPKMKTILEEIFLN
ncbi:MAG: tetratricopeptide repeat protein [Promethearchaeota archaeon]|jgi:tetratricopeptide (TPR) repeat protein